MSNPKHPGQTPPDLPPEYAEAYRRGYERAYREAAGVQTPADPARGGHAGPAGEGDPDATLVDVPRVPEQPGPAAEEHGVPDPEDAHPAGRGSHGGLLDRMLVTGEPEPEPAPAHRGEPEERDRPAWLVPALLAGLVVLLLLGAYGFGRVFSDSVEGTGASGPAPDGVELGNVPSQESGEKPDGESGEPESKPKKNYGGPVTSVAIGSASATCQAPASVDAGGNPVRYPPANTYDGDMSTAWRCNGSGVGQSVTLTLPAKTKVGQVGLVPGYAKTDPRNGADRYAENNRITRVRWHLGDGTTYVQRLDGSPENRSMQTRRIPVTAADEVVIEILGSTRGPRNTVAISEVKIGQVS